MVELYYKLAWRIESVFAEFPTASIQLHAPGDVLSEGDMPFKKYSTPLWEPEGLEAIAIEAIEAATTPLIQMLLRTFEAI